MRPRALLSFTLLLTTLSCRSIERFDTKGEAAYCGDLVSGPSFTDGFLPALTPPQLRFKLTLDTSQISSFSESKTAILGRLSSNDAEWGLCSENGEPLFQSAPLRAIPQVYHDSISTLSFGEGHDDDFFAWVDSKCQGTMLVVVSLLRSGEVETRLFKPAALPAENAGPAERPGFALSVMRRNEKGCEF